MTRSYVLLMSLIAASLCHLLPEPAGAQGFDDDADALRKWHDAADLQRRQSFYEAARAFESSAAREHYPLAKADALERAGQLYHQTDNYEDAIRVLESAAIIYKTERDPLHQADALTAIGRSYYMMGSYEDAFRRYSEALGIYQHNNRPAAIASTLIEIGSLHRAWGRYDEALSAYAAASDALEKADISEDPAILTGSASVLGELGKHEEALARYSRALAIYKKAGNGAGFADTLQYLGRTYSSIGKDNYAVDSYRNALEMNRQLGRFGRYASCLFDLAASYLTLGEFNEAINAYKQELSMARQVQDKSRIGTALHSLGAVYYSAGLPNQALQSYQEAEQTFRQAGRPAELATTLDSVGKLNLDRKDYPAAIRALEDSASLREKLRETASGDARRDYLASQIHTYELLVEANFESGNISDALRAVEKSRSRYLSEQMASRIVPDHESADDGLNTAVSAGTALIVYSNVRYPTAFAFVIDSDGVHGKTLDLSRLKVQLGDLIHEYLHLLSNPNRHEVAHMNESARALYRVLLEPLESFIVKNDHLIILPEGDLDFLPFEALVDSSGHYLVESRHVGYAHSMQVLRLLMSLRYSHERKPMLAFGAGVYQEFQNDPATIDSRPQLIHLRKEVEVATAKGNSFSGIYRQLGVGRLRHLPGAEREIASIGEIIGGAKTITGGSATEATLKALSRNGELAEYEILHFATHSVAVPEIPELSALVLSKPASEFDKEDGFLRVPEIAELKLAADFVNLASCSTALGKVYPGEGVVGLTQAFLLAGAKGVSVSLWPVADQATADFMGRLYRSSKQQGGRYDLAITEVKRQAIRGELGDRMTDPFFWAPFVYYGVGSVAPKASTTHIPSLILMFVGALVSVAILIRKGRSRPNGCDRRM